MKTATFGDNATGGQAVVPALGYGCMGLSWAYVDDTISMDERRGILRQAADAGVRLFDTSDQYGPFANETLVGEALEERRSELFLATKGGLVVDTATGRTGNDGSPEHLHAALNGSLHRLGTDHVDLYQLHRVDPGVPLERSWEALAQEAEQGRARYLGLSEVSVEQIERAQRIRRVDSVQSELSLWSRETLDEVVPYCEEHGIVFIAYAPLGRGFLTGAITSQDSLDAKDMRLSNARFRQPAIEANTRRVLDPLRQCAQALGASTAQVALAWVLAQSTNLVAIPGTKRPQRLNENIAAASLELPEEWIDRLSQIPSALGGRYEPAAK
jgi:aryl-alcohol dehydrogenase-like predicted oxidoreductase